MAALSRFPSWVAEALDAMHDRPAWEARTRMWLAACTTFTELIGTGEFALVWRDGTGSCCILQYDGPAAWATRETTLWHAVRQMGWWHVPMLYQFAANWHGASWAACNAMRKLAKRSWKRRRPALVWWLWAQGAV